MCEVCSKKLDGIQFTVDNFNMIHCIEDYYRYLCYDKFLIVIMITIRILMVMTVLIIMIIITFIVLIQ